MFEDWEDVPVFHTKDDVEKALEQSEKEMQDETIRIQGLQSESDT